MFRGLCLTGIAALFASLPAHAQETRISEDRNALRLDLGGTTVSVTRSGPPCPPACVQPMQAAPGIATVGELDVLDFLELFVADGRGLLIDVRLPAEYASQTLPGAVNVPRATLSAGNPYRDDLLNALGVRNGSFEGAFDLIVFAGGADDPDAGAALRDLLDAGYPSEKLRYFRNGLLGWSALGLSTASGQ